MPRRFLAWWYISIGAGFVALGARALVAGLTIWAAGLRFLIACGFLALGILTLPKKPGGNKSP